MCLSTAYLDQKMESGSEKILMEYVSTVRMEDGDIILTDMMGEQQRIRGMLTFADLTGGVLKIREITG